MLPRPGAWGVSAIPNASVAWFVAMLGVMALRLESRALNEAVEATAQFFKTQRVVACCGDRLTLACLCLAEPIRRAVVGAATTEDEGFELVLRHKPSLLICSSDLETGYGMNLLRRVKAELPTCQLLIVLVRETQAVVQEAMQAYADAVIFKSSLGTGKGDFVPVSYTHLTLPTICSV